jgi:hypothetical protein
MARLAYGPHSVVVISFPCYLLVDKGTIHTPYTLAKTLTILSYVELSSLLYSTKSLHIQHPSTLVRLSNTIASEHINAITSLHLIWPLIGLPHLSYINLGSYHLHQNEVEAMAIWDTISNMKGLKQLHVELNVPAVWRDSWKGWEGILLDCLLEVGGWGEDRVVEDFGLWIPWPKLEFREEMGRFVKKLGCKIFWS